MGTKSESYEKNFSILEEISEALNRDEIGMDELMEKTRSALNAAKKCIEILNTRRGEFKKIESEFSELLKDNDQLMASKPSEEIKADSE